jgi:hypothetical protein
VIGAMIRVGPPPTATGSTTEPNRSGSTSDSRASAGSSSSGGIGAPAVGAGGSLDGSSGGASATSIGSHLTPTVTSGRFAPFGTVYGIQSVASLPASKRPLRYGGASVSPEPASVGSAGTAPGIAALTVAPAATSVGRSPDRTTSDR